MKRLTALLVAVLLISVLAMSAQSRTVTLRLIETSDVHGRFFPYDFTENKPVSGTLARVSSYVKRLRQSYGNGVLLVDNGDILQGQPTNYWSNIVAHGEPNIAAQVVNYMGYDVQNFGNHDVETGHGVYDKWVKELNCPVLGANILRRQTGEPYAKPYVIIEREGVKVAIIGMLTTAVPNWINEELYAGIEFENMVESCKCWVKEVKEKEKADLIVGLFHSGWEGGILTPTAEENAAQHVAREVDGFDLIFFGHDHTPHQSETTNAAGHKVVCLDPGCWAANVAEAEVSFTIDKGKATLTAIKPTIVSMTDEPIDEQMMTHFAPRLNQIKAWAHRKIGTIAQEMTTRDCYFGNSAFGDLIHNLQLQLTGADISFSAPLSFDSKIAAGPLTVADMFNLYRFENKLYVMQLTGREIKGHLEMSYDQWANTMTNANDHLLLLSDDTANDQQRMGFKNYSFNFDSAAGIDYEVDVTKPDGQKVHILKMSNGQPFDEKKIYKVVMNSYRGNGGGELLTRGAGIAKDKLKDRIIYKSPLDLRHYLMQEIERMGTVKPKANSNWHFVPEEWTKTAAERDRKLLFPL